MVITNWTS